jgi:HSP20 family protein
LATGSEGEAARPPSKSVYVTLWPFRPVQEKKELTPKEEKTVPATRYYVPNADVYETEDALVVVMEVPGSRRKTWISGSRMMSCASRGIDFTQYDGLDPLYTEYNVGHYSRAFTLSGKLD